MKPILLELGPFRIHAYGLALALSFLLGSWLVTRRGRRLGYAEDDLMRLFWWILVSSLIGSRLYYALQHPDDFKDNWLGVSQIWRGGLTQYGGLIGALIVGGLFIRSRGWSFRQVSDLIAPALALGEGITRIGCYFNVCCFGRPCDLPWAVRFPPGSHAHAMLGPQSVHPSQLYLSLANFVLLLVLLPLGDRLRRPGRLFAVYLAVSSMVRLLVDFTRYYEPGDRFAIAGVNLAHSQWVSIGLMVLAAVFWVRARAPQAEPRAPEPGEDPA
jgi:phosphatidylglycerol:prolipoprotein diacylglycerol transferase